MFNHPSIYSISVSRHPSIYLTSNLSIHLSIRSSRYPLFHSFTHSYIHLIINELIHSSPHMLIHLFIHSFIYLFIHSFIQLYKATRNNICPLYEIFPAVFIEQLDYPDEKPHQDKSFEPGWLTQCSNLLVPLQT